MITNYLNVSRIERGKLDFNFQKIDFKGTVVSVMDEFKAVNVKEKKGLDLSLDITLRLSILPIIKIFRQNLHSEIFLENNRKLLYFYNTNLEII